MSTLYVGLCIHEYKPFAPHKEWMVPGNLQKDIEYSKIFIGMDTWTPVAIIQTLRIEQKYLFSYNCNAFALWQLKNGTLEMTNKRNTNR
jgi:hypothetical protein